MHGIFQGVVTYDHVHVNFTQEEWALLGPSQKSLYKEVMLETYRNLAAIGKTLEDDNTEEHFQSSRRHGRHDKNHTEEKPSEFTQCGKVFEYQSHPQKHQGIQTVEKPYEVVSKYMKEHMVETNPVNVTNVVKPLNVTILFKGIKKFIQVKNLMNVISVVTILCNTVIFNSMQEFILLNSANMVKTLHVILISKYIKEHILERSLMNVICVVKPLYITVILKDMKEFILGKNPMNATNVFQSIGFWNAHETLPEAPSIALACNGDLMRQYSRSSRGGKDIVMLGASFVVELND
uniref:uncharacterized protein LOC117703234 n=1 Tax=Arvicanthis niloticus TaxID=61156 RepID=UPI00402B2D23